LDFEYQHLLHFEKLLSLLDKWVLLLKPTTESLTEGYKMMKVGLALNPQLEFYIALSGKAEEAKGVMVFDRFSDFVSVHLEAHLGWLGWMDLADPAGHFSAALHTEPLKYQHWNPKPSLQKFMLAGWIESLEKKALTCAPAGGAQ
jgi:MinD-like ATPase involved in chromosome partitioning or flagellar assembly